MKRECGEKFSQFSKIAHLTQPLPKREIKNLPSISPLVFKRGRGSFSRGSTPLTTSPEFGEI
jgi:hypothetical protein